MSSTVRILREAVALNPNEFNVDEILHSVGLTAGSTPFAEIGTSHEVLVSKLERVIRKACKTVLIDEKVSALIEHKCDHVFDEAVRGVASDVSRALLYGRFDEAESLLATAALDVFATEGEIRQYVLN